jgi:signal peptidase II
MLLVHTLSVRRAIRPIIIVSLVVLADQLLKTWVKSHMFISQGIKVAGNWFLLEFTENNGMAFGYEFAGEYGKIFLTLFRITAVFGIALLIRYCILNRYSPGFVVCLSLILAGALGNIIDSVFYGVIYGYAPLLHGKVVDMLYFPIIQSHYPEWFPGSGGQEFTFFSPVFNLADSSISIGVLWILAFQKNYLKTRREPAREDDLNSEIVEV